MHDLTRIKKEFSNLSEFLIALGDEKRQAILVALMKDKACAGLRVNDLTDATKLSRPAVSHHLKILKDIGLISVRNEGTKNYYFLSQKVPQIKQLQTLLNDINQVMTESGQE